MDDFAMESIQVGSQPLSPPRGCRVAAAVKANFLAERDMDVERDVALCVPQGLPVMVGIEITEFRSSRVARIAGHGRCEEVWVIGPHSSPHGRAMKIGH